MKGLVAKVLSKDEYAKWDEFVNESPQGNIFNKTFWLDIVCEDYKILVCEENGKIVGGMALPNMYKGKFYRMPKLTPQLGVLIHPFGQNSKYSTNLSREMDICEALIKELPEFKLLEYSFSYNYSNMLPFVWNEFKVGVRYTYVIKNLNNFEEIFKSFQYEIKYECKKAIKNGITVNSNYDIEKFYEINKKTFDRQGMDTPYSLEFLKKLDDAVLKNSNRKLFFAEDSEGRVIAASYIIYDDDYAYYLMGGADPEFRNTGAQNLVVSESIKFSCGVTKNFDFEGSMIKSIERSFRQYGGEQTPIYTITKSSILNSFLYEIGRKHKDTIKKFLKV